MGLELLTDPDAFFRRRAEAPSLAGPAIVVLLVAAIGVVGSVPAWRATAAAIPDQAGPFVSIAVASGVIGGVIGMLVTWLLYTAAFHAVSAVAFGASGSVRTTLALTGWGFVPRIPDAVVQAAISSAVFSGVTLPSDPQRLQAFLRGLRGDPLFLLGGVLGIAFLLWSALLWTFAMRHGRGLTLRQAAATVAIPVAVVLAFDLLGIAGLR